MPTAETILLGQMLVYLLLILILLTVARFVFSIGRIVRNQEKLINILSGIAIKQNVDSNFLK